MFIVQTHNDLDGYHWVGMGFSNQELLIEIYQFNKTHHLQKITTFQKGSLLIVNLPLYPNH
jgi:hypothetical protein